MKKENSKKHLTKQKDIEPSMILLLNNYLKTKSQRVLVISCLLAFVLGILFFDPNISIGGDDAGYIHRAFDFVNKNKFPTFQGPLYPLILSIFISIFGVNLLILKGLSLLFVICHIWLFYIVFRRYLPPILLTFIIILISINSSILFFASSTYTEAFFMFIQTLFIYTFDKFFIRNKPKFKECRRWVSSIIIIGLLLFLMSISKNIGYTALIAVLAYFLLYRNWIQFGSIIIVFFLFQTFFSLAKYNIWDNPNLQISSQANTLLLKNPYNKTVGNEDFYGFVLRFVNNSKDYLSNHFLILHGLKKVKKSSGSSVLTISLYIIFIIGFFVHYRKNQFWTFISFYIAFFCGVSFIVLQTYWSQERLILPAAFLILTLILYYIYHFINNRQPVVQNSFVALLIVILIATCFKTGKQLLAKQEAISHYLKGEQLYEFSQDWVNYFEMVRWTEKHLPEESKVACRKPGMAFIYSNNQSDFYGIWNVPSKIPDELYKKLKDAGVTHIIMASLRLNPKKNTGKTISTVRRFLTIINQGYPGVLKHIHTIGKQEPAYLYEIK